jgi:hypothetical protein
MKMKIKHVKICEKQVKQRGKFVAVNIYIKKEGKSQINYLNSYFKIEKKDWDTAQW